MDNNLFPSEDQAIAAAKTDKRYWTHDVAICQAGNGFERKILPPGSDMTKLAGVVRYFRKGQPINLVEAGGGTAKELLTEEQQTPAVAASNTS